MRSAGASVELGPAPRAGRIEAREGRRRDVGRTRLLFARARSYPEQSRCCSTIASGAKRRTVASMVPRCASTVSVGTPGGP